MTSLIDVIIALLLGSICFATVIVIIYFAYQGGKKDRKDGMDKAVIIVGVAIALVVGFGIMIAAYFFN